MTPLRELLSCMPGGVSMTPGKLGRNEESESFIFLAGKIRRQKCV